MSFDFYSMFLFSGTSHKTLAQKIAQEYGFTFGKCEIKKFSCNETYVKLEDDVRGQDCTIFQTIAKNVNDEFMEVFCLPMRFAATMPRQFL